MLAIAKSKNFQLLFALLLGAIILMLPRPEGTKYKISGDAGQVFFNSIRDNFTQVAPPKNGSDQYIVEAKVAGAPGSTGTYLVKQASAVKGSDLQVDYVNGLSPKAKRFLAILVVLIFLFMVEPIPLEITAILIGASLVVMGIVDVKSAWAPYMHPVVVFIMCCLIFAIALDKAGLTKRLGHFIVQMAGTNVVKFTFVISIGLGLASSVMHDAAAVSIGIVTMLPLMKAAGIKPHSGTAKFMLISLAFACSCGGMGSLIGGGRCMVSAAFLKEFTGLEITFMDWIKYAMPLAIVTVPASVLVCYLVFRPDTKLELPKLDEDMPPWTFKEIITVAIIVLAFIFWLTKGMHGIDYSVTGMIAVALLVLAGILKWDDVHENLEWGTALFIFGGGLLPGSGHGLFGCRRLLCQPLLPHGSGRRLAGSVHRCGCFRRPGDQCHGQCGRCGPDPAHRDSHGPVGRRQPHRSGTVPRNRDLLCHASGDRLSSQCHRLQLPAIQGRRHHQGRSGRHPCPARHSRGRRLHLVEYSGTGVINERTWALRERSQHTDIGTCT